MTPLPDSPCPAAPFRYNGGSRRRIEPPTVTPRHRHNRLSGRARGCRRARLPRRRRSSLLARDGRRALPITLVDDQEFVALDDLAATFQLTVREESRARSRCPTRARRSSSRPIRRWRRWPAAWSRCPRRPRAAAAAGWCRSSSSAARSRSSTTARLDLRKPSRLLVVGDLRVPRVIVRYDPSARRAADDRRDAARRQHRVAGQRPAHDQVRRRRARRAHSAPRRAGPAEPRPGRAPRRRDHAPGRTRPARSPGSSRPPSPSTPVAAGHRSRAPQARTGRRPAAGARPRRRTRRLRSARPRPPFARSSSTRATAATTRARRA